MRRLFVACICAIGLAIVLAGLVAEAAAARPAGRLSRPAATAHGAADCPHSSLTEHLFNGTWDGRGFISNAAGRVCRNGHSVWESPGSPLNDSTICYPSRTSRACPDNSCSVTWALGRHPAHSSLSIYWCGVIGDHSSNFEQGINYCIGYGKGVYGNPKPAYVVVWGRYTVHPDGTGGNPNLETYMSGYHYGSCPRLAHHAGRPTPVSPSSAWAPVTARSPIDLGAGYLSMGPMSCVSSRECVVASSVENLSNEDEQPLLWNWNGRSWTAHRGPGSGSQTMFGSACGSPSSCWATGTDVSGSQLSPVIDHFDGHHWSTARGPGNAAGVVLNGVACASASDCFAVGTDETSSSAASSVIEHYDGHGWKPAAAPVPQGAAWSVLISVTCYSSSDCMALGQAQGFIGQTGFFYGENYNGHRWSIVGVSSAKPIYLSEVTGLSESGCIRANECLAVGGALEYAATLGAAFPSPVAEDFNGTSWVSLNPPAGYIPEGDSCLAGSYCWVAMEPSPPQSPTGSAAALAHWDGSRFTVTHLAQKGAMYSVACLSGGWCMALGEGAGADGTAIPLAEEDDPAPAGSLPGRPHG